MPAVKIIVKGRVQGVGFRYTTKMLADKLNVKGLVKNLDDGSVYIEAQASKEILEQFIAKVKASPSPAGYVSEASITSISENNYSRFNVVYY